MLLPERGDRIHNRFAQLLQEGGVFELPTEADDGVECVFETNSSFGKTCE